MSATKQELLDTVYSASRLCPCHQKCFEKRLNGIHIPFWNDGRDIWEIDEPAVKKKKKVRVLAIDLHWSGRTITIVIAS